MLPRRVDGSEDGKGVRLDHPPPYPRRVGTGQAAAGPQLVTAGCRLAAATLICAGAFFLASCSSVPSGEPDPLTATTSVSGSVPAAPLATRMAAGTHSEGWTLIGMDADGRRLFIDYALGDPCSESAGILVEESVKTVNMTATTRV